MTDFEIRDARRDDVPDLIRLVQALAEYEREPASAVATTEQFANALFPAQGSPAASCLVVERDEQVVAMALWFTTFSTWTGQQGMWLEDLFVEADQRGSGIGRALLGRLAQICVERGFPRFEWTVLDWNTPSIEFYRSRGALPQSEWTTFRLDGEALDRLAGEG
ncbi:GCN5 family acetyltransferase [Humibacillus sp. DSM 29435]|uniref:GNAT family N-acetyltransferase n=1 Tax=Humibacillus sp. DSM 29435 TaxID=1869167 RepID=UPI000872E4F7|nr:GNAT family N-acetyltransferase [Humibacillus sp. DSM 29435]OFE14778.1 GCN5 family acetyltransferase [Humibacillus sp. DSM 29435]